MPSIENSKNCLVKKASERPKSYAYSMYHGFVFGLGTWDVELYQEISEKKIPGHRFYIFVGTKIFCNLHWSPSEKEASGHTSTSRHSQHKGGVVVDAAPHSPKHGKTPKWCHQGTC